VAYVDWSQQEFAIAAYRSGDANMIAAHLSGDCYLAFGKQAGLIPPDGTKQTHASQRELCKQCVLGVQYGIGAESLALRIGKPAIVARDLLRLHRETYAVFWRWSDAALDTAMSTSVLHTAFGWHIHVGENPNPRSLRNFLMQGNGAEMTRITACLATERGLEVCAPIHDAFLIAAPLDKLDADIVAMQQAMAEGSQAVLGFAINTDVAVVKYPNRYQDERGAVMWRRVLELLPPEAKRATA
jgi:DNA polymerase I-like protein with 3'-5' exonuclease and polymerase domains